MLWQADGRNDGLSIPWTKISLHAISRDPVKCIYFMLDYRLLWPGVIHERNGSNGNGDVNENDDDVDEGNYDGKWVFLCVGCFFFFLIISMFSDDDAEMTQMWLIPDDSEEVDKIYNAMVQCQILNPDPNDSLSEDGKNFFHYTGVRIGVNLFQKFHTLHTLFPIIWFGQKFSSHFYSNDIMKQNDERYTLSLEVKYVFE